MLGEPEDQFSRTRAALTRGAQKQILISPSLNRSVSNGEVAEAFKRANAYQLVYLTIGDVVRSET